MNNKIFTKIGRNYQEVDTMLVEWLNQGVWVVRERGCNITSFNYLTNPVRDFQEVTGTTLGQKVAIWAYVDKCTNLLNTKIIGGNMEEMVDVIANNIDLNLKEPSVGEIIPMGKIYAKESNRYTPIGLKVSNRNFVDGIYYVDVKDEKITQISTLEQVDIDLTLTESQRTKVLSRMEENMKDRISYSCFEITFMIVSEIFRVKQNVEN